MCVHTQKQKSNQTLWCTVTTDRSALSLTLIRYEYNGRWHDHYSHNVHMTSGFIWRANWAIYFGTLISPTFFYERNAQYELSTHTAPEERHASIEAMERQTHGRCSKYSVKEPNNARENYAALCYGFCDNRQWFLSVAGILLHADITDTIYQAFPSTSKCKVE